MVYRLGLGLWSKAASVEFMLWCKASVSDKSEGGWEKWSCSKSPRWSCDHRYQKYHLDSMEHWACLLLRAYVCISLSPQSVRNDERGVCSLPAYLFVIMNSILCCRTTKCMCASLFLCVCDWLVGVTLGGWAASYRQGFKETGTIFSPPEQRLGMSKRYCGGRLHVAPGSLIHKSDP